MINNIISIVHDSSSSSTDNSSGEGSMGWVASAMEAVVFLIESVVFLIESVDLESGTAKTVTGSEDASVEFDFESEVTGWFSGTMTAAASDRRDSAAGGADAVGGSGTITSDAGVDAGARTGGASRVEAGQRIPFSTFGIGAKHSPVEVGFMQRRP